MSRLRAAGETVIHHIYDRHFAGAAAADFVRQWKTLAGRIDEPRYGEVLRRLEYQAGHAEEWRDAVDEFFFRKSGIADEKGRVGAGPPAGRVEAESMTLEGYAPVDVAPAEAASGGKAVRCDGARAPCVARFRYAGAAGRWNLGVRFLDQSGGVARFKLRVAGQVVDEWRAGDALASAKLDAHRSTRRLVSGIALRTGDEIRVEGFPDAGDVAALDYLEIAPSAAATPAGRPR